MKRILFYLSDTFVGFLSSSWLNIFATLYFNFRFLPFMQAIKMPIYLYGNPKILGRGGKVIINGPIKRGMIIINKMRLSPSVSGGDCEIIIFGTLVFNGSAEIECGCRINVLYRAKMELGWNFRCGSKNCFVSSNYVSIGNDVNIAHEVQIMDSNFHYMVNIKSGLVSRCSGEVIIGEKCWIGNRTSLMKGTYLPTGTVVASNSLVNKKIECPDYSIIGGSPAKLIKEGYARIRNRVEEAKLGLFFQDKSPKSFSYSIYDLNVDFLASNPR